MDRSRWWFWSVLVVVAFGMSSSTVMAEEIEAPSGERQGLDGGLVLAGDLFVPAGAAPFRVSEYVAFFQPSVGYVYDSPAVFAEAQTMVLSRPLRPFLAVMNYPLGGLTRNMGRQDLFTARIRWALGGDEGLRFDLGPVMEWAYIHGWYWPTDRDPDESLLEMESVDVSAHYVNLGVTAGVGVRGERIGLNVGLAGGNGWSGLGAANPFVGLNGTLRVASGRTGPAFTFSLAARVQQMSYEGVNMDHLTAPEDFDIPDARWLPSMNVQAGVVIPLVRTAPR